MPVNVNAETLAQIGTLDIEVNTEWNIKLKQLKNIPRPLDILTKPVPTDNLQAITTFSNNLETLDKIGLNSDPSYTSSLAQKIQKPLARYAKGLEFSLLNMDSSLERSLFMDDLDALVGEVANRRTRRIVKALENGDSDPQFLVYDDVASAGKQLFANDHTLNGVTIDNLYALPLTGPNLNTIIQQFLRVPFGIDEDGDTIYLPSYTMKFTLWTPPSLRTTAFDILDSKIVAQDNRANDNPFKGLANYEFIGEFQDNTDWYVTAEGAGLPTLFQTIKTKKSHDGLTSFTSPSDRNVGENKMLNWLVDVFEETYPVHYFLAAKSVQ